MADYVFSTTTTGPIDAARERVIAALAEVEQNYGHHAESALAIANSHFDSDGVLNTLIADVYRSEA